MRSDGEGTDERITTGARWRRPRSANSLERDVLVLAIAFAVLAVIGWGAVYLSQRAREPIPESETDPTLQQR